MLKVGIVGLGYGLSVHLPAFSQLRHSRVSALCDGRSGKAVEVTPDGIEAFSSWQELVSSNVIDVLAVATPPSCHRNIVTAAVENGLHVLCEKPFGLTVDDASHMVAALQRKNVVGSVGFQFRFIPEIQKLKEVALSGVIGEIRELNVAWLTSGRADPARPWSWQNDSALGGGVINSFLSHIVDIVSWVGESPIVEATGRAGIFVPVRKDGSGRDRVVTAEDFVSARFILANQIVSKADVSNCHSSATGLVVTAIGDKGQIKFKHVPPFGLDDASLLLTLNSEPERQIDCPPQPIVPGEDSRLPAMISYLRVFENVIFGSSEPDLPRFEDGLNVRRVIDALRLSLTNERREAVGSI